jgi:fermentation-respiration switch protein FrsA (DUF1100 family)
MKPARAAFPAGLRMNQGRFRGPLKFLVEQALILVAAMTVVAVFFRAFENRFVYYPPRYPDGFVVPKAYGLAPEEVWITAADGVKLDAWFLAAPSSPKVLLWFHGNAENIGMGLEQMKAFARLGANILALDYRGYGKSEGSPDEAGVYRDGQAAYEYLVQTRHFEPRNIFLYGHSLGGAVAVDMASKNPCGGLIVESSLSSGHEMARLIFHVPGIGYIFKNRFDSAEKISSVRAPVLIIHGTRDEVIPFWMGQKLFESAREPKSFFAVEGAGHNDVLAVGGEAYLARLGAFLEAPERVPAEPARPAGPAHPVAPPKV